MSRLLRPKTAMGVLGCLAIGGAAAACGGSGSHPASVGTDPESTGGGARPSFANFAMATGKVASVGNVGATVTTSSGSKKVAFGTITTFTLTSSISRAELTVGDCVRVTSAGNTGSRALPTARPTGSPGGFAAPTRLTANAVTITSSSRCRQPANGSGFPPGFGGQGSLPSGVPTPSFSAGTNGFPGNFGSRRGAGGRRFGLGASGTVSSISGSTFTIDSSFGNGKTTVTTTGSTTYSMSTTTKASAVKVGRCLAAIGTNASGGILDARTVTLSEPVNGSCPARAGGAGGFGGFGGFGGPPGGQFGSSGSVTGESGA